MQGIWWYLLWFWQIALLLGDFLKRRKFNLMFWGKGNSYIDPTICRKVTLPKTNSECHWKMGAWGTIRLSFWAKGLFSGFMWDLPHTQYQWKVKVWFGIRHLKCFRILLVTAWYEILLARISYHENLIRVPPQRHRDKALLRSINHHHPLTRLYFLERGGIGNSHDLRVLEFFCRDFFRSAAMMRFFQATVGWWFIFGSPFLTQSSLNIPTGSMYEISTYTFWLIFQDFI